MKEIAIFCSGACVAAAISGVVYSYLSDYYNKAANCAAQDTDYDIITNYAAQDTDYDIITICAINISEMMRNTEDFNNASFAVEHTIAKRLIELYPLRYSYVHDPEDPSESLGCYILVSLSKNVHGAVKVSHSIAAFISLPDMRDNRLILPENLLKTRKYISLTSYNNWYKVSPSKNSPLALSISVPCMILTLYTL